MDSKSNRSLRITRILNAPRELVWEVWTNPEHIAKWWGPNGFTNTIDKMEVKPGGEWTFVMRGPDGVDYRNESVFTEVVEPERIGFKHMTGPKFQATVNFIDLGNKTELTWEMVFDTPEELQNVVKVFKADEGLKQNVEKLDKYLTNL